MIQSLWRTVWQLKKKILGIKLPYNSVSPILDMYLDETIIEKDT